MKRREQEVITSDLGAATIAILLAAWGAESPDDVPREHGFTDGFLEFYDIGRIANLWRPHETRLREQARLWGWSPTFTHNGALVFYWRACDAHRRELNMLKRVIDLPALTPAMIYALMVGESSPARLRGWVALGMHGELTEADAWAQHRDASSRRLRGITSSRSGCTSARRRGSALSAGATRF